MICRPHNQPTVANELEAMVCWMADAPLREGGRYLLKHTTRTVQGRRRRPALPDRRQHAPPRPGRDRAGPQRDRPGAAAHERRRCCSTSTATAATTGGFILIDEATQDTVGAGMVVRTGPEPELRLEDEIEGELAA